MPPWEDAEAAVVVDHIVLSGSTIWQRPRMRTPGGLDRHPVTPVVHVDLSLLHPPVLNGRSKAAVLNSVLQAATRSTSGWVQLDMEARPSHRAFYVDLVRTIRQQLPGDQRLSVTGLAWWCRHPDWIDSLKADEIVPMFFRMGKDGPIIRQLLNDSPGQLHPRCGKGAAGFALQEIPSRQATQRFAKQYWFDYKHWRQPAAVAPNH